MELANYRLMIVAYEKDTLEALTCALGHGKNWAIENFTNTPDALRRARTEAFQLFIADYNMPEINGVEFLDQTKELHPDSIRVILGGHNNLDALTEAVDQAGIYRIVRTPWNHHDLITTVEQALRHYNVLVENRHLAEQVRRQRTELARRKLAIDKLSKNSNALVNIKWSEDGCIELDDGEGSELEYSLAID